MCGSLPQFDVNVNRIYPKCDLASFREFLRSITSRGLNTSSRIYLYFAGGVELRRLPDAMPCDDEPLLDRVL